MPKKNLYVVMYDENAYNLTDTIQADVKSIVIHADFNYRSRANDIAILTLITHFVFMENLAEISKRGTLKNEVGVIAGFGRLYDSGPFSGLILYEITMVSECSEIGLNYSTHDTFCAINPVRERGGVCQGASGGGLVRSNYEVFGILSSGSFCGGQGEPAIFTDVFLHKEWIDKVMNGASRKCPILILLNIYLLMI
ncbi:hypothetical protein ACFFRR_001436 [Megaselia abdita]